MPRASLRTPISWLSPLNSARREVRHFASEEERIRSFGGAIDELHAQLVDDVWPRALRRLAPDERARWYLEQVERFRNIELRGALKYLNRRLSYRVEKHLFPGLSRVEASRVASRVSAICYTHGVRHQSRRVWTLLRGWEADGLLALPRSLARKIRAR